MAGIDTRKLEKIEAQLTEDTLSDDELVTELNAAGLLEVARVVAGLRAKAAPW
jgi:DNA-directed RNA polymerase specialized sigma54-like protein